MIPCPSCGCCAVVPCLPVEGESWRELACACGALELRMWAWAAPAPGPSAWTRGAARWAEELRWTLRLQGCAVRLETADRGEWESLRLLPGGVGSWPVTDRAGWTAEWAESEAERIRRAADAGDL